MKPSHALIAALVMVSGPRAQVAYDSEVIFSPEAQVFGLFGSTVLVHDLNEDGFGDAIVTESWADVHSATDAGIMWILWGPTLKESTKIVSKQPVKCEELGFSYNLPPSALVADLNGDDHVDILMSSVPWMPDGTCEGFTGRVHIFWGPDWAEDDVLVEPQVYPNGEFGFGALAKDIDGDGVIDLLIGAPTAAGLTTGNPQEGRVWIWPGQDLAAGDLTHPVGLPNPRGVAFPTQAQWFGEAIRAAPYDDDGVDDLWIAATDGTIAGGTGQGYIHVFDGVTRAHVATIPSLPPFRKFGDLRYKGDLDGDGVDDIVVSAPTSIFVTPGPIDPNTGAVVILAGPDYTRLITSLWSPQPTAGAQFGVKSEVLDLDGDGDVDVVVGDPGSSFVHLSAVRIFHGPEFASVETLEPIEPGHAQMGAALDAADLDGDGLPEILAGAVVGNGQGSVHVFSPRTLTARAETLSVSQGGRITLSLRMPHQAGHAYLGLLTGSGSGEGTVLGKGSYLPLQPDVLTFIGLDFIGTPLLQGFSGVLDARGEATLVLDWPAAFATELAGTDLTFAVLTSGNGRPGAGSSAVTLALVP